MYKAEKLPCKQAFAMCRVSFPSRISLFILFAAFLPGCAAGPDFLAPAAPDVSVYDFKASPEATSDGAQNLLMGEDIPAQWWELFHSKNLNNLIVQAIKHNPDLASAEASLRVAQDNLSAGGAAFFPSARGTFSSTRAQASKVVNNGVQSIYTLHNASVGVSYNVDVWGGTRRTVEKLQAQVDAARFQREAAYLTLTSNVVTLAVTEASLREQIGAAEKIIEAQEKVLNIFKLRFASGSVAKSGVLAQESALASSKATLPSLHHQLIVTRHALLALMGKMPSEELVEEFKLSEMCLPEKMPLSLPSRLVEQRPDVRVARENLHAASAGIGVAEAARLPNITLSADIGSVASVLHKLFTPGGGFWDLGASAAQTFFDAGALADQAQATRDEFDLVAAQYRKTVLAAFQDVADTLHALHADADSLVSRRDADKAAVESLTLMQAQFDAGAIGLAELLLAQQSSQQAKAALAQSEAQRYADTAALFAALGGGWWNRDAETSSEKGPL